MGKIKSTMKGVWCQKYKGSTYWYAWIDDKSVSFGEGDQARELAEVAKAMDKHRKYVAKERSVGIEVERPQLKTVDDLIDWYLEDPDIRELKSFEAKKSYLKHLRKYFGNRAVQLIDSRDQKLYRKNRRAQGAKDGTLNNEIGLLSTMFHMAVKDRKIPADFMPTEFVRKFSQPPRRRVEEEEYQALLEHADDDFRDVLICGYESAMRNSEIRNLTKRKVNLNVPHISGELLDYIYLGIFETKNETERVVPVSAELKEVLERRIKRLSNDDLVFTHNSRPYSRSMVSYFMQTTCERAKVPYGDNDLNADGKRVGIVFHSLRHTRTSLWVEEGSSDEIIRRATGHLSLAAFHRYVSQIDAKSIMRLVKTDQHSTNKNLTKTA